MGEHQRQAPLTIRPGISRRLLLYVLLTHGVALAVLVPLPLGWITRGLLAALVLLSLGYSLWAHVLLRAPWSVAEAVWSEAGWTITTASGQSYDARLLSSTYVGVGLVILNLRAGLLRRPSVVLTPDSIDPEQLRRLRARLRLSAATAARARPNQAGAPI
jgi:toxin CptA